jgi:outer membrane lipoprotein SlyB
MVCCLAIVLGTRRFLTVAPGQARRALLADASFGLTQTMTMRFLTCFFILFCAALPTQADDQSLNAALGGALGGGFGAYIGNELWGRDGAIVGGALGGATGAALSTEGAYDDRRESDRDSGRYYRYPPGHSSNFCPPGQAKKGRC